jgi:hypothetical protein
MPGTIKREVDDDLLDVMDLYETTAMESLDERNVGVTGIADLVEARESLLDVAHMTVEPASVVLQESIEKLKENKKSNKRCKTVVVD